MKTIVSSSFLIFCFTVLIATHVQCLDERNLNRNPFSDDQFDFVFGNDVEVANQILQDGAVHGARNLLVDDTLQKDVAELVES